MIAEIKKNEDMDLPQVYVTGNIPKPLHAEDWDLRQVHSMIFADQLEQPYDGGSYMSPINQWIEVSCAHSTSFCLNFSDFLPPNNLMFRISFIQEKIAGQSYFISLFLSLTKHKKKKFGMEKMLEWFHWLYEYT